MSEHAFEVTRKTRYKCELNRENIFRIQKFAFVDLLKVDREIRNKVEPLVFGPFHPIRGKFGGKPGERGVWEGEVLGVEALKVSKNIFEFSGGKSIFVVIHFGESQLIRGRVNDLREGSVSRE